MIPIIIGGPALDTQTQIPPGVGHIKMPQPRPVLGLVEIGVLANQTVPRLDRVHHLHQVVAEETLTQQVKDVLMLQ
jgi:hypothetical protein